MKHGSLDGCSITLYPFTACHVDSYIAHYSTIVQKLLHVDNIEQELRYVQECLTNKDSFFYVIVPKATTIIIGAIEIRRPTYRSQLYCWLNEQYWGNGYFQEAMQLLALHYFKVTGQPTISACVDYHNERSFYALKKAGFQEKRITPGPYGLQYELILKNIS